MGIIELVQWEEIKKAKKEGKLEGKTEFMDLMYQAMEMLKTGISLDEVVLKLGLGLEEKRLIQSFWLSQQ